MKNRRRKFGNIELLKSGKYRAMYQGPDGKRYRAPQTFFDEGDAAAWLRSEQKLIEYDEWTAPNTRVQSREDKTRTVGEWMEEWLTLRTTGVDALEPSTLQNYRNDIRLRIQEIDGKAARLRDIPLTQLTRRDVSAWFDDISARFKPVPVHNTYKRLRTALEAAVDRDMIPANPATIKAATKRPKFRRKELPERKVMQAIVDELDHSKPRVDGSHKLIAIFTFFHGHRISEALALRRKDIVDLEHTVTVKIRGTVYRVPEKGMIRKDRTKTEAGHRDTDIFPAFHEDLRYHLDHFVGDGPDALLFTTSMGSIVMDTSYRSILNRAKKRAGYEDMHLTPHYGRNWLITTLAEANMPIPAIGEYLGQRDLRTITEIYMRATEDKKSSVLATVNSAFTVPDGVVDLAAERKERGSKSEGGESALEA